MIALFIIFILAFYVGYLIGYLINYEKKINFEKDNGFLRTKAPFSLGDVSEDIDKDLHINDPAGKVCRFKNNKYGKVS